MRGGAPATRACGAERRTGRFDGACSARGSGEAHELGRQKDSAAQSMPAPADKLAATGIGRQVDHQVERVSFDCERKAAASLSFAEYAHRPW